MVNQSQWIDSLVLAAGVAENYALPTDAQIPAQKGTMFRITSNAGPIYVNWNGTAVIPVADVTTGLSSIILRTDLGPILVMEPSPRPTNLSFISPSDAIVTIEVWN